MIKHKEQRVGIFIDIQNLYHSSKNLFQARVNYKELIKELVAGRKLIRAIGYVVKTESTLGEASFFDALDKNGIELRMKDIQIFPGGMKKADWDVGMAVDSIRMANSVDVVVLVTGDGDFVPLVEYLKWGLGKSVEVAGFGRSASGKLREAAETFINLDEIPKVILKKKNVKS
ncbi:MAG: NYN domain-containing protein [Patescibacteria group bacterium]